MGRKSFLAVALACLLAVATVGCAGAKAPSKESRTVTVNGTGKAFASPDQASVAIIVRTNKKTSKEALDQNSQTTTKIYESLAQLGIPKEDLKTGRVSIHPECYYEKEPPRIIGYIAENSITIKTKMLEKVAEVYVVATENGATEVTELSFELSDDNEAVKEALEKAVDNARHKAEALARSLAAKVGKATKVTELRAAYPQPFDFYGGLEAKAAGAGDVAAPPIEPGKVTITAEVKVTFELK